MKNGYVLSALILNAIVTFTGTFGLLYEWHKGSIKDHVGVAKNRTIS